MIREGCLHLGKGFGISCGTARDLHVTAIIPTAAVTLAARHVTPLNVPGIPPEMALGHINLLTFWGKVQTPVNLNYRRHHRPFLAIRIPVYLAGFAFGALRLDCSGCNGTVLASFFWIRTD